MSILFCKELLDEQDVALVTGVCSRTLHRWREKGRLPYVKIDGKIIRYRSEDVERLFDAERLQQLLSDPRPVVKRLLRVPGQPVYSYFRRPVSNTHPHATITITDAYNYLQGDRAYLATMALRTLFDDTEKRAFKAENFDYVTFGGVFSQRDAQHLVQPSGLLCLDIDHVADRDILFEALCADPNLKVELLFRSPVDGLKVVVSIDLNEAPYEVHYAQLSDYIALCYGYPVDKQCSSQAQACFLPYDPHAFINPKWIES